ncbi:helix-turn-helix transcriptional regulator [Stenotrophomonas rhizophila]|uniref:AraC family transcriptional regulator n=1 Tax=Stenotrophomonas rhizophila TaxID=216778 RepID=UPI0031C09937|nr:helix-turn-helix transcriptional regulator [Stenotrophomonas rhizophila]MCC7663307.1 helix-turn-helix transcriptional regulator [Stenotrophomonas rhizophila]
MHSVQWVDRGHQLTVPPQGEGTSCVGISRMSSVQLPGGVSTLWMQLRGNTGVHAREGEFRLKRGDWMVLERDSRPTLQADRLGICVGLCLSTDTLVALGEGATPLYPGRGRMSASDLQIAVRLWRRIGQAADGRLGTRGDLRPLLLHMADLQRGIAAQVQHCPGRSLGRKRHVLARLQRARLFLEGHTDRVVRIGELAELANLSYWYFSKAFQGVYGESPQAFGARVRLELAARLLRDSDMIVGEIAAASGFEHAGSFARAFRAHFGACATAYRDSAWAATANSAHIAGASRAAQLRATP